MYQDPGIARPSTLPWQGYGHSRDVQVPVYASLDGLIPPVGGRMPVIVIPLYWPRLPQPTFMNSGFGHRYPLQARYYFPTGVTQDFFSRASLEGTTPYTYFSVDLPLGWSELPWGSWEHLTEYPSEVVLNRQLLWHHTWTPYSSGLVWDITHPPSVSRVLNGRLVIVKPDFKALALENQVGRFELWTDHAVLASYMERWGAVPVYKGEPTVGDLLEAIYEYLKCSLTEQDLQSIQAAPQNIILLRKARKERVKDGFQAIDEVAMRGPFRRSDVVGGHRRFQGVRAVKMGNGTTRLYFNLGPGPVPHF